MRQSSGVRAVPVALIVLAAGGCAPLADEAHMVQTPPAGVVPVPIPPPLPPRPTYDRRPAPSDPARPLVGRWREQSHEGCSAAVEIRELTFDVDGRFALTWRPFESYIDYVGTWREGPGDALALTVERGNDVPPLLDLDGTATVGSDGALTLTGFQLGSPRWTAQLLDPMQPQNCTYVFVR